jgi:hypothetical protein
VPKPQRPPRIPPYRAPKPVKEPRLPLARPIKVKALKALAVKKALRA